MQKAEERYVEQKRSTYIHIIHMYINLLLIFLKEQRFAYVYSTCVDDNRLSLQNTVMSSMIKKETNFR